MMQRSLPAGVLLAAAWLAAGCATVDPYRAPPMATHLQRTDAVGDCARLLRSLDERIDALGVRDAQEPRVTGFPYLRVDRFTASLAPQAQGSHGAFGIYSELLAQLDASARAFELRNAGTVDLPPRAAVDACRYLLAGADHGELARLVANARVPDDYSSGERVLGLYALTRIPFAFGVQRWQQDTRAVFATAPADLARAGVLVDYAPGALEQPLLPPQQSAAFGLPAIARAQWLDLLQRHAPLLQVDTASDDDRIGRLRWTQPAAAARLVVDVAVPAAYARIALTRMGEQVLPQLVYVFWFPARPAEPGIDLLAGEFSALIWRVTLARDGQGQWQPLVYDSIHACGCYHQFFATARVRARAAPSPFPDELDEGLFMPQEGHLPALRAEERIVLRVASRSHYLQHVAVANAVPGAVRYELRNDDELRALPLPDGRTQSIWDATGRLPGSERLERLLFWPMGIGSAGQLRQWGRHATAFVGRRHFDDPHLLDQYFERTDQ